MSDVESGFGSVERRGKDYAGKRIKNLRDNGLKGDEEDGTELESYSGRGSQTEGMENRKPR